jgi:hypothetical protein
MFIIWWRGWGLMAIVAVFLPLGSCVGLLDTHEGLAFLLCGITLVAGGVACWVCGRRWNHTTTEHSLYFIPLQYWGLAYILFGAFNTLGGIAGLTRKGL